MNSSWNIDDVTHVMYVTRVTVASDVIVQLSHLTQFTAYKSVSDVSVCVCVCAFIG